MHLKEAREKNKLEQFANRVEKLVGLPRGWQRAGFRFAVADYAGDDEIGIVERSPEGMAGRIPKLAIYVVFKRPNTDTFTKILPSGRR
jgi:hypothetical protein